MAYQPTVWVNGETPINDTNLNKMERGIQNALTKDDTDVLKKSDVVDNLESDATDVPPSAKQVKLLNEEMNNVKANSFKAIDSSRVLATVAYVSSETTYVATEDCIVYLFVQTAHNWVAKVNGVDLFPKDVSFYTLPTHPVLFLKKGDVLTFPGTKERNSSYVVYGVK